MRRAPVALAALFALALTGCAPGGSPDLPEPTDTTSPPVTTDPGTEEPTGTEPTTEPTTDPADGRDSVTVEVVLAEYEADEDVVHVSVVMAGIAEEGGDCVATATRGDTVREASQQAIYNVNRVECGGLRFAVGALSSGTWSIQVAYESSRYVGASQAITVEVP